MLLEFLDDVLSRLVEAGIFMHKKKRSFDKLKIKAQLDIPNFDDTYSPTKLRHVQTAFYFLILGYV